MSRLTRLEIENLMSVKHVVIEPKERGITTIGGLNGAGKSVTINAVDYLFGGADTHPPEPIRVGEETSRIIGDTPEFQATRRWWRTPEGVKTELKVVSKVDGHTFGSPQKMFDAMYPVDSDPTAFFRLKDTERRAWLQKVVGIDPAPLDKAIAKVFDARADVNRDLNAARARLAGMPDKAPPQAVDTAALLKEQAEAQQLQQACSSAKQADLAAARRMTDTAEGVKVAEQALAQAKTRHAAAMKQAAEAETAFEDAVEAAEPTAATLERVRGELTRAQASAAAQANWKVRQQTAGEVEKLAASAEAKTTELEKLRGEKEALLKNAKFPIEGIGFGESDVTFNGLPLEQASGAERIRIGASLIAARNPKLRIMRVPEGEKLDENNLAALDKFCEENDFQCQVERVGEGGASTIIIRDGRVYQPEEKR